MICYPRRFLGILHIFCKPSRVCILAADFYRVRNINTARGKYLLQSAAEELQLLVTLRVLPDRTDYRNSNLQLCKVEIH